jgi:hypothetical protein
MASAKDRRSPRVHVALDVFLQTVDGDIRFKTSDASYQGIFIVSPDPLPLRKLIRFRTRLTTSNDELQMLGLVAHTVNAEEAAETGERAGMGIQLFSLGRATRQAWRDFVDELYQKNPAARRAVESARRPQVKIRIPNPDMLKRFRNADLPSGKLFLRTPELHPPGTEINCVILHPVSGQSFIIPGEVLETIDGSVKERGMQLAFSADLDDPELIAFLDGVGPDEGAE